MADNCVLHTESFKQNEDWVLLSEENHEKFLEEEIKDTKRSVYWTEFAKKKSAKNKLERDREEFYYFQDETEIQRIHKLRKKNWELSEENYVEFLEKEIIKNEKYRDIWAWAEQDIEEKGLEKTDSLTAITAYSLPSCLYMDLNKALRDLGSGEITWEKFPFKSLMYLIGDAVEEILSDGTDGDLNNALRKLGSGEITWKEFPFKSLMYLILSVSSSLFRGVPDKHYDHKQVKDLMDNKTPCTPGTNFLSSSTKWKTAEKFRNNHGVGAKKGTIIIFKKPNLFSKYAKPIGKYAAIKEDEILICPWGVQFIIDKVEYTGCDGKYTGDDGKCTGEEAKWQYIYLTPMLIVDASQKEKGWEREGEEYLDDNALVKKRELQTKKNDLAESLEDTANYINDVTRKAKLGQLGATSASVIGGVMTVVGGALTIATLGAAAPVLITGIAITGVGAAGNIGAFIIQKVINSKQLKQTDEKMKNFWEDVEEVQTKLSVDIEMIKFNSSDEERDVTDALATTTLHGCATLKAATVGIGEVAVSAGRVLGGDAARLAGRVVGSATIVVTLPFLAWDIFKAGSTVAELVKNKPTEAAELLMATAKELRSSDVLIRESRRTEGLAKCASTSVAAAATDRGAFVAAALADVAAAPAFVPAANASVAAAPSLVAAAPTFVAGALVCVAAGIAFVAAAPVLLAAAPAFVAAAPAIVAAAPAFVAATPVAVVAVAAAPVAVAFVAASPTARAAAAARAFF